jgi:hypothetical protein
MRFGAGRVAEASIGEGERVVQERRSRVEGQRRGQVLDGGRVVVARQRRAAETAARGNEARLLGQGALEQRRGRLRLVEIEICGSQPDQRRHVVRARLDGVREPAGGGRHVVGEARDVPQEIGPARFVRLQILRAHEAQRRRLVVLGRHEQLSHFAKRPSELGG